MSKLIVQFCCYNEYYILLEMIVEKMNILKTVFLWYYSEEIYYQNLAWATNPISNFKF